MIAPEAHKASEPAKLTSQNVGAQKSSDDLTDSLDFNPPIAGMGGSMGFGGMGGMSGMGMGGMGGIDSSSSESTEMGDLLNRRLRSWREASSKANSSIAQTAQSGALGSASNLGESVRYLLKSAVSVGKGQTALLHLADVEMDGKELSLFNPSIDPQHPLHAISISNSTRGAFTGGPISIFSGDAYRGDALIDHWPAGAARLISYAIDTQVNVRWQSDETPLEYAGVFVTEEDDLIFLARETLSGEYQVENRSDAEKLVWIEHPRFRDWTLTEPKTVAETAADRYRIEQKMQPQKEATVLVKLSRNRLIWPIEMSWRLNEKELSSLPFISESVRKLLQLEEDYSLQESSRYDRYDEVDKQIEELKDDQDRLRDTIRTLEKFPEQAKPFIEKLLAAEQKLAELAKEAKKLNRYADGDEVDPAVAEAENSYLAERAKLIAQIRMENPADKAPFTPTTKEIQTWKNRIQHHPHAGGGMGGIGGGFF